MYCDFFAITNRLTNTCKFELMKRENNNGQTKLGQNCQCSVRKKSNIEVLVTIYGFMESYWSVDFEFRQ